jgi:hypothetical protein
MPYAKTGHFSVPTEIVGTTGQTAQKRGCPLQNGTYGHLGGEPEQILEDLN